MQHGSDPDHFANTDWAKEMFRTAAMHQHHLSVNGGSKAVHYMISTQYFQQDGILRETANQRFNFRSNLDAQLGIVKLGLNLSGSRQNIDEPTTSVTGEGLMRYLTWFTRPTVPVRYSNGHYGFLDGNPNISQSVFKNPIEALNMGYKDNKHYRFDGKFFGEIDIIKEQLEIVNTQIKELGFVGNISKEFLDKHSAITGEINALRTQNQAFLKQKELQEAKANADEVLRRSIEDILREIEVTLNDKMKEFNDSLFSTQRKPPYIHFNRYDSYKFETPMDTGTGSNYKGMIVYDLAMLFSTALPALAHDSLLFKNLEKNVEDGIIKIYNSTKKQVFIAYDKQGDCRPETRDILERNCVLRLSNDNCELYGRSWNIEE